MNKLSLYLLSISSTSCTDATFDQIVGTIGHQAEVQCYSGGQKIFSEKTTGKVHVLDGGGYSFRTVTGGSISTFADCFVIYLK